MLTRAVWLARLQERPDRPQGRQRRQLDVLVALAGQLDADTGDGTVTMAELVKISNTSERTVRRALGWAVTSGLLRRTARGHRLGDGTTSRSGWLLLGEPEPQPANPPSQPANPTPQPASRQPQAANSPKAANTTVPNAATRSERPAARGRLTKADLRREVAEFRKWASRPEQPPCPHGQPGGHLIGPDEIPMCASCRHGLPPDDPVTDTPAASRRTT